MAHSKNKGSAYERKIAKEFREFGFEDCKTSRFESKMLDDSGVDLTNTGFFSVQCKAVERLGNYHDILKSMPVDNNYNVIFHK
jgi:Holliday junction resolvase